MDWKMANMDGATAAMKIIGLDPQARIVLISGYEESAQIDIETRLKNVIKDFIIKPFDLKRLSEVVARALSS
jgi:DNA-binding NtrC family response regulator